MRPGDKAYVANEVAALKNTMAGSLNSNLRRFHSELPKTRSKLTQHNLRCLEAALEALTNPFRDDREHAETLCLEQELGFHK